MSEQRFTWDERKADENLAKHGVSFELARAAFRDPLAITLYDRWHSQSEERFVLLAEVEGRLVVVCFTIRGDETHVISARNATRFERRRYMNTEPDEIRDAPMEDMGDIDTSRLDWSKAFRNTITPKLGPEIVHLDEDVRFVFHGDGEVNNALRLMIKQHRIPHFANPLP